MENLSLLSLRNGLFQAALESDTDYGGVSFEGESVMPAEASDSVPLPQLGLKEAVALLPDILSFLFPAAEARGVDSSQASPPSGAVLLGGLLNNPFSRAPNSIFDNPYRVVEKDDPVPALHDPGRSDHGLLAQLAAASYKAEEDASTLQLLQERNLVALEEQNRAAPEGSSARIFQERVDNADNGLQLRVFDNQETGELIIAFRGTDGAEDIPTNALLGAPQYAYIAEELQNYLQDVFAETPDKKIVFTGHSLGGGLAETASYFTQENNPAADISVVSYNGFGAKQVIEAIKGEEIDGNVAESLNGFHYRTAADPVAPLGTHITRENVILKTGDLNPLTAHRMPPIIEKFEQG